MTTDTELMAQMTARPPLSDLQRLEGEAAWLLEALEYIREHSPDSIEAEPGGWIVTESVMWRVRERLRTGEWQDVEYDRWADPQGCYEERP